MHVLRRFVVVGLLAAGYQMLSPEPARAQVGCGPACTQCIIPLIIACLPMGLCNQFCYCEGSSAVCGGNCC
jgi:hypothetical protein